jgi:hypothetical protein
MIRNVLLFATSGLVLFSKEFVNSLSQVMCVMFYSPQETTLNNTRDVVIN